MGIAAKANQASELSNASSLSSRSTFPWSCPELEEFCLGASCKSGCPCPLIVGDTCVKVKRRNTGVSCNIMSCSFSSVSNAYCMGRFGNKICLCNPGMAFHNEKIVILQVPVQPIAAYWTGQLVALQEK